MNPNPRFSVSSRRCGVSPPSSIFSTRFTYSRVNPVRVNPSPILVVIDFYHSLICVSPSRCDGALPSGIFSTRFTRSRCYRLWVRVRVRLGLGLGLGLGLRLGLTLTYHSLICVSSSQVRRLFPLQYLLY